MIRRTRLLGPQAQLFPDWRYHAFVTNLDMSAVSADRYHQPHAGEDDDDPLTADTGGNPRRERGGENYRRSKPTDTTAATPLANSPSATSKKQPV